MSESGEPRSLACASGSDAAEMAVAEVIAEITDRLQAGERVNLDEYIARCPEGAERIRRLAPALAGLEVLKSDEDNRDPKPENLHDLPGGTLGDFRIVREVGRGGMGIVYEAEQISLRRRVALKVLPFATTMDPKQLARFKNETYAAASLQHQNVVPVYFVGYERGVHYYAMQFIDGRPLSDVIRGLRQSPGGNQAPLEPWEELTVPHRRGAPAAPSQETVPVAALTTDRGARGTAYFRAVARLGEQAALALQHAHDMGVLHRDVKPGNLLLDARGNVWVTDFGLAHVQGEASLTVTGDLVGTLRYMSPEQALAHRVVIDHRTDVYSLGATLYELLTLRPPFAGKDRQELLRQIAFEEPTRPRRGNAAIPAELETIVLKALEKAPQDRYTTMQEMADDLRRWQEDKAIAARRPSLARRLQKWGRRHRGTVWAALAFLLVTIGMLAGNLAWWFRETAASEGAARWAIQEACRLGEEEKWFEALGAVKQAEQHLARAGTSQRLRQQAVSLGNEIELGRRLQAVGIRLESCGLNSRVAEAVAEKEYTREFRWYGLDVDALSAQEVAWQLGQVAFPSQLAAALDTWAFYRRVSHPQGASHLVAISRVLDPDQTRNQLRAMLEQKDERRLEELVTAPSASQFPAATLTLMGKRADGTKLAERMVSLLRQAQRRKPDDFRINLELAFQFTKTTPVRLEEAVRYLTVASAIQPYNHAARVNLVSTLTNLGRYDEAIQECRDAIHLTGESAAAHNNLGAALQGKGQVDEATLEYQAAVRLEKDNPAFHCNLADALLTKGKLDKALASARETIRLNKDYAGGHFSHGRALQAKGQLDEAIASYREAIRADKGFAPTHLALGTALHGKGKLE